MSLLDVGDKLASIFGFILALTIAIISLIQYIRRERALTTTQRPSITRLRRAVLAAAGCAVLALLALAVLSDPDFAFFAIYFTVAFILGGLLGQTVREWVYAPEIEDATTRRLRFVDRVSTFAWISLLLLLEIGLIVVAVPYSTGSQLFFQVLLVAGCILLTYYPYHLELRSAYRNREDDADHAP